MTAQFHKILQIERQPGVLIVVPRGDSVSFRSSDVSKELASVVELARAAEVRHVVVDLGSENYFGTVIIGAINQIGQTIAAKGGRLIVCRASDDMLRILKVMHFDDLWPVYPTRKDALKALSG